MFRILELVVHIFTYQMFQFALHHSLITLTKRTMEFDKVPKMFVTAKITSFGGCDK